MFTLEQWVLTAITCGLMLATGVAASRVARADRGTLAALWGAAAVALAVRWAVTVPTFIHANLQGTALVDAILAFPSPAVVRASYGQYSFLLLGAIARVFGRSFEAIVATNQVAAAASLGVAGLLARNLTGVRAAAFGPVVVGTLFVPLARTAASEDAHNLAVLLGLVGMWGFHAYAGDRAKAPLAAAVCALLLMVDTRQTAFPLVLCALALSVARGGRSVLRDPVWLAAAVLVLSGLAVRIGSSMGVDDRRVSSMALIFTTRSAIVPLVLHEPLIDVRRFGPALTALVVIGALAGSRRRREVGMLSICLAMLFVFTLPLGFPTPGVEYSFRTPTFAVALVVAGVGAAWSSEALRARFRDRAEPLVLGAFALLSGVALWLPGWRDLARASPESIEYRFVQSAADSLPHEITLVHLPLSREPPSYVLPIGPLVRAGHVVHTRSLDGPRDLAFPTFFLFGVQCHARAFKDLLGDVKGDQLSRELIARLVPVFFDRAAPTSFVDMPAGARPPCEETLAAGTPFGSRARIDDPQQDLPFVVYPTAGFALQLVRVEP
jgi:hypothetical protein